MKKIRHFLNLHELSQSDMHKIVSESHRLKKDYGKFTLKKKKIIISQKNLLLSILIGK